MTSGDPLAECEASLYFMRQIVSDDLDSRKAHLNRYTIPAGAERLSAQQLRESRLAQLQDRGGKLRTHSSAVRRYEFKK